MKTEKKANAERNRKASIAENIQKLALLIPTEHMISKSQADILCSTFKYMQHLKNDVEMIMNGAVETLQGREIMHLQVQLAIYERKCADYENILSLAGLPKKVDPNVLALNRIQNQKTMSPVQIVAGSAITVLSSVTTTGQKPILPKLPCVSSTASSGCKQPSTYAPQHPLISSVLCIEAGTQTDVAEMVHCSVSTDPCLTTDSGTQTEQEERKRPASDVVDYGTNSTNKRARFTQSQEQQGGSATAQGNQPVSEYYPHEFPNMDTLETLNWLLTSSPTQETSMPSHYSATSRQPPLKLATSGYSETNTFLQTSAQSEMSNSSNPKATQLPSKSMTTPSQGLSQKSKTSSFTVDNLYSSGTNNQPRNNTSYVVSQNNTNYAQPMHNLPVQSVNTHRGPGRGSQEIQSKNQPQQRTLASSIQKSADYSTFFNNSGTQSSADAWNQQSSWLAYHPYYCPPTAQHSYPTGNYMPATSNAYAWNFPQPEYGGISQPGYGVQQNYGLNSSLHSTTSHVSSGHLPPLQETVQSGHSTKGNTRSFHIDHMLNKGPPPMYNSGSASTTNYALGRN